MIDYKIFEHILKFDKLIDLYEKIDKEEKDEINYTYSNIIYIIYIIILFFLKNIKLLHDIKNTVSYKNLDFKIID
jgi:uncharacterized Tic20 family protein